MAVNEIGRDDDALLDNLTADQSCGTLIAPNRWLFPIMIVVSVRIENGNSPFDERE